MENIKNLSSEALATQIVIYRLIGINKDLSVKCMEELFFRKENGDNFNFEKYIEDELNKSPKMDEQENTILQNLLKLNFKDL